MAGMRLTQVRNCSQGGRASLVEGGRREKRYDRTLRSQSPYFSIQEIERLALAVRKEPVYAQISKAARIPGPHFVLVVEMTYVRSKPEIGHGTVESGSLADLIQYYPVFLNVFEKLRTYDGIVVTRRKEVRLKGVLLYKRKIRVCFPRKFDPCLAEVEADISTGNIILDQACELPRATSYFEYGLGRSSLNTIDDHGPQEIVFRLRVVAGPSAAGIERRVVPFGPFFAWLLHLVI